MKLRPPALAMAVVLALSSTAFAQPTSPQAAGEAVVSSQTYPHTGGGGPGVAGPEAVNPAPGVQGPYIGAGRQGFYDVDKRIADIASRVASLKPPQRRHAASAIRAIKSQEASQRARHGGDLRDWDRENLNDKIDLLIKSYPGLGAQGVASVR